MIQYAKREVLVPGLVTYSLETVNNNKKCQSVIALLCQSVKEFGKPELLTR